MANRYQEDVFDVTADDTNDVYSALPAISIGEYAEELSVYTDKDGNKAVILPGWTVSGRNEGNVIWGKDVSLVIYRIPKDETKGINWNNSEEVDKLQRTYDQLVWCPVSLLDADGTLDGGDFKYKFGRRNFRNDDFSDVGFTEVMDGKFFDQVHSIKAYGGFYITRYNLSEGKTKPRSIKKVKPWTNLDFPTSMRIASEVESTEFVQSHLLYGAETDTINAWLIKSGSKNLYEIAKDSTKWGNYYNAKISSHRLVVTGKNEDWCANNIYDWAGNVDEWTQEEHGRVWRVLRGGDFYRDGYNYPVAIRQNCPPNSKFKGTGCRAAFYIRKN